jgi:hypothetical protein
MVQSSYRMQCHEVCSLHNNTSWLYFYAWDIFSIMQCVLLEHILQLPLEIAQPAQRIVLAPWPDYLSVHAFQATTEQRLGRRTYHAHVSTSYIINQGRRKQFHTCTAILATPTMCDHTHSFVCAY